jgi:hypothetical protein
MDFAYFNAWSCFFQFFFGLFIGPAVTTIDVLDQDLHGSFGCLVGSGDGCSKANVVMVLGFILANCMVGASISLLLHYK